MKIRPLYDRIVVKRIEEQETTRNGIVIPDSAKEKPQEGEVMAIGKGKRLDDGKMVALDVKAGDRILFGKYSGNEIKLDGTEYIIMREDDVPGSPSSTAARVACRASSTRAFFSFIRVLYPAAVQAPNSPRPPQPRRSWPRSSE